MALSTSPQEWMWLHIELVYNCGTKQGFFRALVDAVTKPEKIVTRIENIALSCQG